MSYLFYCFILLKTQINQRGLNLEVRVRPRAWGTVRASQVRNLCIKEERGHSIELRKVLFVCLLVLPEVVRGGGPVLCHLVQTVCFCENVFPSLLSQIPLLLPNHQPLQI